MNLLTSLCMGVILLAITCANPTKDIILSNAVSHSLKPSQWLNARELEDTPSLDDVTLEQLAKMSIEEGTKLMQKWYHISQINCQLPPSFVPSPSNIPVYILKNDGKKETANLNSFVKAVKQDTSFGDEEVTIFITGLPSTLLTVKKANRVLVEAYIERYSRQQETQAEDSIGRINSEETSSAWNHQKNSRGGNLIIIDLGQTLDSVERFAMLGVDDTGAMIAKTLVQLNNDCNVPREIIHIVAQGIAAHVAGAAGDEYTRLTGRKLRRITALDPSKIWAKTPQILTGLTRGDAEFVDAIHTNVYGMGTLSRVGDIDFFPNGPCIAVPGAENIIEAAMRATRYFAESVRPGNERNFPAIEANSLTQYKSNKGFGKRAFMGIATDYDLRGDFMLEVNAKSPFGIRTPALKQNEYHGNLKSEHH